MCLGNKFGSLEGSANRAAGCLGINDQDRSPGILPGLFLGIRVACPVIAEKGGVPQAQLLEHFQSLAQGCVARGRLVSDHERLRATEVGLKVIHDCTLSDSKRTGEMLSQVGLTKQLLIHVSEVAVG